MRSKVDQPPNIIYIMADDLGWGELGSYGQQKIKTPHLDRLAAQGIRLTRFYAASPVCAPTRCSLLTGKHQGHAAIRGNKELAPGFGPNDPEGQWPLPQSETTIAEVLKKKGYATGLIGKWGLGGPGEGSTPLSHGFDQFYGYLCQKRAHNHYPTYLWKNHQPDLLKNLAFNAHQRLAAAQTEESEYDKYRGGEFAGEKMASAAVEFVASNRNRQFFLYYAPTLPHAALQAPKEWVDRYPREWDPKPYLGGNGYLPTPRPHATYAAMISFLDDTVGRIVQKVDELGLAENTLIVFTSDNGTTFNGGVDREFFNSVGGLRGFKTNCYEGGIRVPFIARWTGKIAPGTVSNRAAACYDTLATLAELTGAKAPKSDGSSFLPTLLGKTQPAKEFLYFEYPEGNAQQVVMFGKWKAIRPNLKQKPDLLELYDLEADPSETANCADQEPEAVKRAWRYFSQQHQPNADFPLFNEERKVIAKPVK